MMAIAHRIDFLRSLGRIAAISLITMTAACGGGDTALPTTSSQGMQTLALADGGQPPQPARLLAVATATVMPAIAVGLFHSLALKNDGTVWSWGNGGNGQLGNNSTSNSLIPVQVVDPSGVRPFGGVTSIAAGQLHSMALKSDGTVWSWGYGGSGVLGNNSNQNSSVPVQVVGSGGVGSLGNVSAIATSASFSMALKNDGTVWTWGLGGWGELGNGDTSRSSLVPVQVVGPGGVGVLTGVTAITAGYVHAMALRSDGTVWDWGDGQSFSPVQVVGAGGVGTLGGVTAIAAGSHHSLALKNDGTVWSWGSGGNGALGNNSNSNSLAPVQVLGPGGVGVLAGVTAIAVGETSSLALKNDGTVWAWGYGYYGELGNNTTSISLVPVQVVGPSGFGALGSVAAVTAHFFHSMALKSDGTVWAWGLNMNGELGNGSIANSSVPVQVVGPGGVGFLNLGSVEPPLTAPKNLRGTPSAHSVDLRWDGVTPQFLGVNVYVRPLPLVPLPAPFPSNFQKIAPISGVPGLPTTNAGQGSLSVQFFQNAPMLPSTRYEFAVTTVNKLGVESAPSSSFIALTSSTPTWKPKYPVVFVHGIASNALTWDKTKDYLTKHEIGWSFGGELTIHPYGYPMVTGFVGNRFVARDCTLEAPCATLSSPNTNTNTNTQPDFYTATFFDNQANYSNREGIRQQGREIKEFLRKLRTQFEPGQKFIVVAHSMGGLATRSYMEGLQTSYADDVAHLITLGTPHAGSPFGNLLQDVGFENALVDLYAYFSPIDANSDGVRDMRPVGSQFLNNLNTTALPSSANYTAIVSFGDPSSPPCGYDLGSRATTEFTFAAINAFVVSLLGKSSDCVVATGSQDLAAIPNIAAQVTRKFVARRHWDETSDYVAILDSIGPSLRIESGSPVDLEITDPSGAMIKKGLNEIPGSIYEEVDVNANGDPHDVITITFPLPGSYRIKVVPNAMATPDSVYTLSYQRDGLKTVLASNQLVTSTPESGFTAAVQQINQAPVLNVGPDQVVRLGSTVRLTAADSFDPDRGPQPVTFNWRQVDGPTVNLVGSTSATPRFVASSAGLLTFVVSAFDGQDQSTGATVRVAVPPLGDIDLDGDVNSSDLAKINSALNTQAAGPNDLRDLDGDGKITGLDARKLVTLCTRPRCATQ